MPERYNQIYRQSGMLYNAGSPVVVFAGAVLEDTLTRKTLVHFKYKSVSEAPIRSMTVSVLPICAGGADVTPVDYTYSELDIRRDDFFGEKTAIVLNQSGVVSYKIRVTDVEFANGAHWRGGEGCFEPLRSPKKLEDAYNNSALSEQFRIKYGKIDSPCIYLPERYSDMWYCTCGAFNLEAEPKCHKCRRVQSALLSVDENLLRTESAHRVTTEKQYVEIEDDEDAEKRSRIRRLIFILLPIVIVLSLVLATVPGYLHQKKQYEQGTALLEAGKYDQAAEILSALGEYNDCSELVQKEIPYRRAMYIMDCADSGSADGLVMLGMKRSELGDGETVSTALYSKAVEMFSLLGGYKDSNEKIVRAQKALADYSDALISGKYNDAAALLNENRFCEARDAFEALGNYQDSAEMVLECIYRKASNLRELAEKYNMDDIMCNISTTTGEKSLFYIPTEIMTAISSDLPKELRAACGDDVEIEYKEAPEDSGCIPYTDAVAQLFEALGDYKDSANLTVKTEPEVVVESADPFYEMCAAGNLTGAVEWLQGYNGTIDNQELWLGTIAACLPFCGNWSLEQGDSYLLTSVLGLNATCMNITTSVSISAENGIVMRLSLDGNEEASFNLTQDIKEDGTVRFSVSPDGVYIYYLLLNDAGKLCGSRYSTVAGDTAVRSCVYKRVG